MFFLIDTSENQWLPRDQSYKQTGILLEFQYCGLNKTLSVVSGGKI